MWIAKGTLLALWLFGFGTMAFFYLVIYRHLPPNSAVGASMFITYTIDNNFWWIGLMACFAIGFVIARAWTGPLGLWIALLVTGLIPAGCLKLFLVLAYKLKQASQGGL
jgi:hypothetical protein